MNSIITGKLNELKTLCKTYGIKTMYVFGSVCTSKFNDRSDIDFLVSFDNLPVEQYTDNFFDLYYHLQNLFEREIDLLTDKSLSNPYFIESIEENKQLIYAA
jgi:predicted nucleotidyltransferase